MTTSAQPVTQSIWSEEYSLSLYTVSYYTMEPPIKDPPRRRQSLIKNTQPYNKQNLQEEDSLSTMDKVLVPMCPLIGSSTVHVY